MNLFFDTNAVIKLFHVELGTEKLTKLVNENAIDLVLTVSDITRIEFYSVLMKKVRIGEIEKYKVSQLFELLESDLNYYNIIKVDEIVKNYAIKLIDRIGEKHSLRTMDAIQLSSAIIGNELLKIDYFVTSDKKLQNSAKEYFLVFNPELKE